MWAGNYNMLDPADPPRGDVSVNSHYNVLPGPGDTVPTPYGREIFPGAPTVPDKKVTDGPETVTDRILNGPAEMEQLAENQIENEEVNTFTVQGQCKHPGFIAGKRFGIVKDETGATMSGLGVPSQNQYLITQLSFAAVENTYGHHFHQDVLNWIDSPIRWIYGLFREQNNRQGLFRDPLAALASGGLGTIGDQYNAGTVGFNTATVLVQGLMQTLLATAPKEVIACTATAMPIRSRRYPTTRTNIIMCPARTPSGRVPMARSWRSSWVRKGIRRPPTASRSTSTLTDWDGSAYDSRGSGPSRP